MKKVFFILFASILLVSCNPSKEQRIQKLEAEIEVAMKNIDTLKTRIEVLEIEKNNSNYSR